MRSDAALDTLCKRYREIIKERTRFSNRKWALENGDDKFALEGFNWAWREMTDAFTVEIANRVAKSKPFKEPEELYKYTEKFIQKAVASQADLVYKRELFEWLGNFNGLKSGTVRFELINHIGDISAFSTVSKLQRFAGYGVYWYWNTGKQIIPVDGWKFKTNSKKERMAIWTVCKPPFWEEYHLYPRPITVDGDEVHLQIEKDESLMPYVTILPKVEFIEPKEDWKFIKHRDIPCEGYARPYNVKLKTILHLIIDQFMRNSTEPYRSIYDREKQRQIEKGLPKSHAHNRALRKMKKEFLKHLWVFWRDLEGLDVTKPYG